MQIEKGGLNNNLNTRLNKEYSHDFSICDIDGVSRCFYKKDNKWINRLVFFEAKRSYEKWSKTQISTLKIINKAIDWSKFDDKSGMFVLKDTGDNETEYDKMGIYKIDNSDECEFIKIITIDAFYKWISCKDIK